MREDLDNQGSKLANDELVEFDLIKLKIFYKEISCAFSVYDFFSFFVNFTQKAFNDIFHLYFDIFK